MTDPLEQTIVTLAHASADALARHDVDFFTHLLDEAFVYINANGETLSKQEYMQRYVEPPEVQWVSQTLEETRVRFYGNVAILTGRLHDRLMFASEPFEGEYVTTRVYVRDSDQWRCVSGHTSQRAQET
jgi:ketosteroid isomerase-like protein